MVGRILKTLAMFLVAANAFAASGAALEVGVDTQEIWLGPHLDFLQSDVSDPASVLNSEGYFRVDKLSPSWGYTNDRYWARLTLNNTAASDLEFFLVFKDPLEVVHLYQYSEGEAPIYYRAGMFEPETQGLDYRYPVMKVVLSPGPHTLLMTMDAVAPHFPVLLQSEKAFETLRYEDHMVLAFVYGISAVLLAFAILSAATRPNGVRVHFALSYLFCLGFSLFVTGAARPFLHLVAGDFLGNLLWLEQALYRNWIVLWGFYEFFSFLFAWHFLELTQERRRRFKIVLATGLTVTFSFAIASFFDPVLAINVFSPPCQLIATWFAYVSFKKYREGFTPALNYAIGWLFYAVASTFQLMYFFGLLDPSVITAWGLLLGLSLQYFFLGLAILQKQQFVETSLQAQKDAETQKVLAVNKQLESNFEKLKRRDEIVRVFVSPAIQYEVTIGRNPLDYEPRRVNRNLSFTDMRGFTALSEKVDLKTIYQLLNDCFRIIIEPIFEHNGQVDKLIGDCVMAVFKEEDAQQCLQATLEFRKSLSQQNRSMIARGLVPVKFGTAIALGEVISGNFGTAHKMDRTVLGDAVNTASRLESETKTYQVDVLASESFINKVGDYEFVRPIDHLYLKGKEKPIMVYEIFGHNIEQVVEFKLASSTRLREVIHLKHEGDLDGCERILEELIAKCPAHTYKENQIMDPTLMVLLRIIREKKATELRNAA